MITIFPCGSRRSKGVPFGHGVFLRLLVGEETCPNFRLWQTAIPMRGMQNATTRRVRSEPKMSENAQFWGRMYFIKYLHPYPKITPKPHFGGPFNAMAIIHGALRKWLNVRLTVSRTLMELRAYTMLKLYSYIGIGKYLGEWVCQNFSARARLGGGPLNANLGPPYYLGNYWS